MQVLAGLIIYHLDVFITKQLGINNVCHDINFLFIPNYETGQYSFLTIPKDESFKIDLTGLNLSGSNTDLDFGLKYLSNNEEEFSDPTVGAINKCKALAEVKFTIQNSSGVQREYKTLLGNSITSVDANSCEQKLGFQKNSLFLASISGSSNYQETPKSAVYVEVFRLQNIITSAGGALPQVSNSDKVTLYVKPLYYDAAIALTIDQCDKDLNNCTNKSNVVAGPYTNISTTGYYGGTTRKLEANIDRQSGTLYDLFDYVIYKAS